LTALGANVLVISFEGADAVARFGARLDLPFRYAADPQRAAYERVRFGRASLMRIFSLRTIWKYARLLMRGMKWQSADTDDNRQLGGDVVVSASGEIVFAYASKSPADRPRASALNAAVERALGTGAR
jgi:hypothetical protein